jgi:conjugal transfer mating pair stabilization protein TraG
MRVSEQDVQEASRQVDAARGEAVAASTERSAVLSEAFSRGLAKLQSARGSTGSTSSSFEQLGQTLNRLDQITKSVAESTGLTQSQVARIAIGAAGHAGIDARFVGARLNASADKSYLSGLSADERKVLSTLSTEQLSEFKQFGDRVSRDASFANLVATDSREARELASRLSATAARSARADSSLAERTALSERVSNAYEKGETISIDIAQDPHNLAMFTRYAEQYGGDSAAAHLLMSAELARQSLKPNRTFSDGTAMPTTFEQVRAQHLSQSSDTALSPDVDARHLLDDQRVESFQRGAQLQKPVAAAPSSSRRELETEGSTIRSTVETRTAGFEARTEMSETDDGTLVSKRSLMKQSAKQAGKDAGATLDSAKEAVKGLLKK